MYISGTLVRSLVNLNGQETLLKIGREKLLLAKEVQAVQVMDRLLAEAPRLSQSAAELLKNDYAVINTHSLISMWSAVEVAIEDTVVLVLTKDATALKILADAGVKLNSFGHGPLVYEEARRVFPRVERQLREKLCIGEFYVKLLELLGINIKCDSQAICKLEEINNVRNCLMHRGGIIDARAAQSVSALQPFVGKQILITQARYHEYFDAVSSFLIAMLNGAAASKYSQQELEGQ
ncbi:MAG TPA: hypothetical protein DER40_10145 [Geobacter sp.]|nr:hypothetical protein [Geobacter sp.]